MRGRKRGEISGQLLRLQRRFAAWRQKRGRGERIPGPLWKAAAKLADKYGLCQTARVLKLDYYSLGATDPSGTNCRPPKCEVTSFIIETLPCDLVPNQAYFERVSLGFVEARSGRADAERGW